MKNRKIYNSLKVSILQLFIFLIFMAIFVFRLFANPTNSIDTTINTRTNIRNTSPENQVIEVKLQQSPKSIFEKFSDPVITFLGILAAAGMVIWQMKSQHRSQLELQKESAREKLRFELYNTIKDKIDIATKAAVSAGSIAYSLPLQFKMRKTLENYNKVPFPIKERAPAIIEIESKLQREIISVVCTIENYEIIHPNLAIFKTVLNSGSYDIGDAFSKMFNKLVNFLPVDLPTDIATKKTIDKAPPTEEELNDLEVLLNTYNDKIDQTIVYLYDLRIEAQNLLLGELFNNRVPRRKPLDSRQIVVTTDSEHVNNLKKYFEEETEWGKRKRNAENSINIRESKDE